MNVLGYSKWRKQQHLCLIHEERIVLFIVYSMDLGRYITCNMESARIEEKCNESNGEMNEGVESQKIYVQYKYIQSFYFWVSAWRTT